MAAGNDHDRAIWQDGFNQGRQAGRVDTRKEVLSLLEKKFMNMNVPTDDPVMKATILVAKEVSDAITIP